MQPFRPPTKLCTAGWTGSFSCLSSSSPCHAARQLLLVEERSEDESFLLLLLLLPQYHKLCFFSPLNLFNTFCCHRRRSSLRRHSYGMAKCWGFIVSPDYYLTSPERPHRPTDLSKRRSDWAQQYQAGNLIKNSWLDRVLCVTSLNGFIRTSSPWTGWVVGWVVGLRSGYGTGSVPKSVFATLLLVSDQPSDNGLAQLWERWDGTRFVDSSMPYDIHRD